MSTYSEDTIPSMADAIGRRGLIQIAVLGALLLATFWNPLSQTVVRRWITDDNWSHGWLVPLFSLYFLSTSTRELRDAERRTSYVGLLVIIASLAAYLATYTIFPRAYARPMCFVGTVMGLILFLGGWKVLRITWCPVVFLVLAVPIPENYYVAMTQPLQRIASVVSSGVLGLIPGLYTEVSGVVIDYSYGARRESLNVEQACAGMRLLMAFVTLGVAMAYLGDRPVWQRVVMLLACVPIAIFCNVLRVTITGVLHVFKDEPIGQSLGFETWSKGTPHAMVGIAMLPIAYGLYALVGWLLSNLYVEDTEPEPDGSL